IIDEIAGSIRDTAGCILLDVDAGASTNRTVYTFVGEPDAVVSGALNAAKTASKFINMAVHKGEHPRLGAMDVCPFIPVRGVTEEQCVFCANELGRLLASELDVPVYLYGAAASQAYRKTVAQIRAGEYEGLPNRIEDENWKPDFGSSKFVPRWGATMVGVRNFLIAYNVNLISTKEQAHRIALKIREQGRSTAESGRLPAVQAKGWWLEEANMAQVSMNLTDHDVTPIHVAYEQVCKDAAALNLPVVGSEIVGLVPLTSLLQVAEYYISRDNLFVLEEDQKLRLAISRLGLSSLKPFVAKERVIEYRLGDATSGSLVRLSTESFVRAVGSRSSEPGGGSVSALLAALGAALSTMVGQMTYGKRQFESVDGAMRELIPIVHRAMNNFLPFVDADAEAFNQYMVALKLPKKTPEEAAVRDKAMQEGLKKAVEVPYNLAKEVNRLWPTLVRLAALGNQATISDLKVGARCLETSVWGAYHNVATNLKELREDETKSE
ncbi:Formimidoyltransferase-cyclodeaminase, partial [Zootermopsis nevadensis]